MILIRVLRENSCVRGWRHVHGHAELPGDTARRPLLGQRVQSLGAEVGAAGLDGTCLYVAVNTYSVYIY